MNIQEFNSNFKFEEKTTILPERKWQKTDTQAAKLILNSIFEKFIEKYKAIATAKGFSLSLTKNAGILFQLSQELVMNAGDSIIAFEESGKIVGSGKMEIILFAKDGLLHLEVEDNGIGIPKNAKMFQNVSSAKGEKFSGGKGGGLYLISQTLTALKGNAGFNRKTQGSVVFYTVPLSSLFNNA